MHIEVIDTNQDGSAAKLLIDRVMQFKCSACSFEFYVNHVDKDLYQLKCPSCSGAVSAVKQKRIIKRL